MYTNLMMTHFQGLRRRVEANLQKKKDHHPRRTTQKGKVMEAIRRKGQGVDLKREVMNRKALRKERLRYKKKEAKVKAIQNLEADPNLNQNRNQSQKVVAAVDLGQRAKRKEVKAKTLEEGADPDMTEEDVMIQDQEGIEAMMIERGEDEIETGGIEIEAGEGGEEDLVGVRAMEIRGEGIETEAVVEEIGMKAEEGEEIVTKVGEEDGADLEAIGEVTDVIDGEISRNCYSK